MYKIYEIEYYVDEFGVSPFIEWLDSFKKDLKTKNRIQSRLAHIIKGNLGDHHGVGHGVSELRLSFGSGYRIYYGIDGNKIIVLLCGGDKGTQKNDIKKAIKYWQDYKEN